VPRIVITLPAYRAERTLAQTVADIPPGVADRLILVDDASPDNTAQLARELGIDVHVHRKNLGYGGNQKTCYTEALTSGADIVVLLHPDYQYEPKAVPLLIAPILAGDADMTFGSRFAGLGDPIGGGMPIYRYVGNRLTTIAENLMLGSRFTELHSGLRAYTRRCLLSLPFLRYSDDFLFDSQLLIDAVTSGQRVVEVPIPTRYTLESSSIAIDRSLAYIAGTLAYCARLAVERGRRGRRSPVVTAPTSQSAGRAADGGGDRCPACAGRLEAARDSGDHGNVLRCTSCGLVASASGEENAARAPAEVAPIPATAILEVVGAYYAPGDRLLALGAGKEVVGRLAQKRGWDTLRRGGTDGDALPPRPAPRWASDHDRIACVVAFLDGAGSLAGAVDEVDRAKALLDREGLLVLATGRGVVSRAPRVGAAGTYALTPQAIHALLKRAGFELVEWIPAEPASRLARLRSGRDSPGADLAVARLAKAVVPSLA
jgi:Glycosyl transferase family 2